MSDPAALLVIGGSIFAGTVIHAVLIEGTMETVSKVALCALALAASAKIVVDARAWVLLRNSR